MIISNSAANAMLDRVLSLPQYNAPIIVPPSFARRGLWESLEQYAARNQRSVDYMRPFWRCFGLKRLGVDCSLERCALATARVAPGLPVPTKHIELTASEG